MPARVAPLAIPQSTRIRSGDSLSDVRESVCATDSWSASAGSANAEPALCHLQRMGARYPALAYRPDIVTVD